MKLTTNGIEQEPIYTHGEEFRVQDFTPPKPAPQQRYTQPMTRREQLDQWNNQPKVKEMGITAIEKTKLWLLVGISIVCILLALITIVWFNVNFSKLSDKNFGTSLNVEQPNVNNFNNYTHVINSQPSMQNDYKIVNNITIPASLISNAVKEGIDDAYDFDSMVNAISTKIIRDLRPFIKATIQNATNTT